MQTLNETLALEILLRMAKRPGVGSQLEEVVKELPREERENLIRRMMQAPELNIRDLLQREDSRLRLKTMRDALRDKPPKEWIIEGVLLAGSVNVVAADPGVGKTYSLLDALMCVARGEPWLEFPVKQGPVLYLDEDNGGDTFEYRLEEVSRGHTAGIDTPFYYLSLPQFDLRQEEDILNLEAKILEAGARVVVIDTVTDVTPGADGNLQKEIAPVLRDLRAIAAHTKAAIVLVAHLDKARGKVIGTIAFQGKSDLVLKLTTKEGNPKIIKFSMEKNRHAKEFSFSAMAQWMDGSFWLTRCEDEETRPAKKSEFTPSEEIVILQLAKNGPQTLDQLGAGFKAAGMAQGSARSTEYRLRQSGYTANISASGLGSGHLAMIDLTDKGRSVIDTLVTKSINNK